MKDINEALDTLINDSNSSYDNSYYEPKKQKSNYTDEYLIKGIPLWAWAGWSGGYYPDWDETSEYHLVKKKAWEILGSPKVSEVNSNNQVNFTIFSGIFGGDMITVLSDINNYDVLKKVCPLIINWSHTKSKSIDAVIISNQESKDNDNYVVAPVIDGEVDDTNNWFTLGSDSFNLNPFNDKNFGLNLKKQLDLLKNK